ncbi:hypothetical protein [Nonomuraea sp. NPDC003214]
MTDHRDDLPLTDEELDDLLDQADADLLAYVRAHTDVGGLLNSMLEIRPAVQPPPPAAAELFHARLRLREIERSLTRADAHARALAASFRDARADELTQAVDRALDSARSGDLSRTPDLLRALTVALARAVAVALACYPRRGGGSPGALVARPPLDTLIVAIARGLSDAGDLAADLPGAAEPGAALDVSGADLSDLRLMSPDLLHGVVWDAGTVWPSGLGEVVGSMSEEVCEGVYRVVFGEDVITLGPESSPG